MRSTLRFNLEAKVAFNLEVPKTIDNPRCSELQNGFWYSSELAVRKAIAEFRFELF